MILLNYVTQVGVQIFKLHVGLHRNIIQPQVTMHQVQSHHHAITSLCKYHSVLISLV